MPLRRLLFMRISYCLLQTLLSVVIAGAALAQDTVRESASLSGYVRDVTSGETLLLANVRVDGTSIGAATNNSGYYTVTGIPPGALTVAVSYIGYRTERVDVELAPGEQRRLDIELLPEEQDIEEVTVTGEREELYEARKIGVQQLQTQLIKSLPAFLQPDVFRSLQLLPGVKAASDYSSGLYIRGGGPDQTLILLDRTSIYNPSHFFGVFSTFNPDAIKDVRLYKGGFPAEYGGRLGSVVDIYNRDGNRREFDAGLSIGLLSSRGIIEGPWRRGSYMLAMRRSTIEPILYFLRKADIQGIPDAFYFVDVNGKFNFDLSNRDFISLAFYAGQDALDIEIVDDALVNIRYGNRSLSMNWTHLFSQELFSNFTFTGSKYFSRPVIELAATPIENDNTVDDISVKGDFEYIPGGNISAKAGFWSGFLTLRLHTDFNEEEALDWRTRSVYTSAYAQATWRPAPRVTIEGGIRGNYFQEGRFVRASPRLSFEYEPAPSLRLQAAFGRYYQFLTLITSEIFSGFDTWLATGEGVRPAYGNQAVIGMKHISPLGFNLDVEAYYRTMQDLFEWDPFVQDVAGLDYAELFHFGDGHAYGLETTVQRTQGRVNGFVASTLSRTRRRFPNINKFGFYSPKHDRTLDVKTVLNVEISRAFRASAVWVYATGQAYTEPFGQYRLVNSPFDSDWSDVLVTEYNNRRLPAYHRLDLGVSWRTTLFGAGFELQAQVLNAYSRRNIWFYFFDFTDAADIVRNEIPQIPVPLPNIAFTFDF